MKRSSDDLDASTRHHRGAPKLPKSSQESLRYHALNDAPIRSSAPDLQPSEKVGAGAAEEKTRRIGGAAATGAAGGGHTLCSDIGSSARVDDDIVSEKPHDGPAASSQGILRQQLSLVAHQDSRFRLRALSCLHAHLDLPCDSVEREFVLKALVGHLWREGDPHVAQRLVRVLASLAILCCMSEPGVVEANDEDALTSEKVVERVEFKCQFCPQPAQKDITARGSTRLQQTVEPARLVVHTFLAYLATGDLPLSCREDSALELQILRSLYRMAEETGVVQLDAANRQLSESLSNSNPFIRAQVLLLFAMVMITDPVAASFDGKELECERLHIFQEYTRDPDVVVRQAALKSLIILGKKCYSLTKGCQAAATAVLQDQHGTVRSLALQVVGLCVEQEPEECSGSHHQTNEVFVQVCRMMIDMDISVRIEACKTVAKIRNVKEDLILQSLSKKPLGLAAKEKQLSVSSLIAMPEGDVDVSKFEQGLAIQDKLAMGVFMHGIEDEFLEVRGLTVQALVSLCDCSPRVRENVLELLMDMLNDVSEQVRSSTLLVLFHVAHKWSLVVKDSHLHMLHGTLEDANVKIRSLGKRLLAEIQLSSIDSFNSTIHVLMNNMLEHPKEKGVMHALYKLGRAHSTYVQILVDELYEQMKNYLSADGGLNSVCCGCILTLFVAAATSDANIISLLPSKIMALARLLRQSLPLKSLQLEVESINPQAKMFRWITTTAEEIKEFAATDTKALWMSMVEAPFGVDVGRDENAITEIASTELYSHEKKTIKGVLERTIKTAHNVRSMLESGMVGAACNVLSGCRKDVKSLLGRPEDEMSQATFALYYIECLNLILQGWIHFQKKRIQTATSASDLSHLCCRLEFLVRCMQHTFVGHSMEQRLQLLELSMVPVIWRVASMAGMPEQNESNKLVSAIASIQKIMKLGSPFTPLVEGVRERLLKKMDASNSVDSFKVARQLAASYWPIYMPISDTLTKLKAELFVPGNDFEHPLLFSPGVPLGITIHVVLNKGAYNCRIWVRVQLDTLFMQHMFLENEKHEVGQPISTTLQVYGVPNVSKCKLRTLLMLECGPAKEEKTVGRGPKGFLLPLSAEKEIHLVANTETVAKNSFM